MTDNPRDQDSGTTPTAAEGGTTGQATGTTGGAGGTGGTAAEGGTTGEATGVTLPQDTASSVGGTTGGNLGRIADGWIGGPGEDRSRENGGTDRGGEP